jgi:hypothetical protein
MSRLEHPYGTIDTTYALYLAGMDPERDGPIFMVNLMRYKAVADYGDGNPGGLTGRQADDRYAPVAILADIGAEVVLFGDVSSCDPDEPRWDRVGVVRYPTRRSFLDMQSRNDFRSAHEHKAAGMETTIVMGCLPTERPGHFAVEGTIIGDTRRWQTIEVRRLDPQVQLIMTATGDDHEPMTVWLTPTIDGMSATP